MKTRKAIEATVDSLRTRHGATTLPIDVRALAEAEGVHVRFEDLEDKVSGALFAQDGNAVMAVNANHGLRRQRFTLAHELGHFMLHWKHGTSATAFVDGSLVFRRDERSQDGTLDVEREANAFAAELLMPRIEVEALVAAPDFDLNDEGAIRKLTGLFGVSEQALTVRLVSLNLLSV